MNPTASPPEDDDLDGRRELKVKLPVRQLLQLHYLKLAHNRTFSDVVSDALHRYLGPAASVPPAPAGSSASSAPPVPLAAVAQAVADEDAAWVA